MDESEAPAAPAPPKWDRRGRKKGGSRNGSARLAPGERELRGQMILMRRLQGDRMTEIAREFRISEATAYRALNDATRTGFMEKARDFVSSVLLPKALAVYEQALDEMDVEVARDVLQGLGITGRRVQVEQRHSVTEDFDQWRMKKAKDLQIIDAETLSPTDSPGTPPAGPRLLEQPDPGAGGTDPSEVHREAFGDGFGERSLPDGVLHPGDGPADDE